MSTTITAYTFNELSPEAKARAMKRLPEPDCHYTLEECMDSLKALCEVAGVTLEDWSLGPYAYSHIRVIFPGDEGREGLKGPRALAWIENNIFGKLRHPWTPATVPPSEKWASIHGRYSRRYTKPEHVPACPLTGVCFDEDLLDVFRDRDLDITLKERFESLAGVIARICEAEMEYQSTDEAREELAESYFDGALFTKDGGRIQ